MAVIAAGKNADATILARFRNALDAAFGDRIERLVLYGSRARGDAQPDSDYDVAVFLRDFVDRWPEIDRLVCIETELFDETGVCMPCHAVPGWGLAGPLAPDGRDPARRH